MVPGRTATASLAEPGVGIVVGLVLNRGHARHLAHMGIVGGYSYDFPWFHLAMEEIR